MKWVFIVLGVLIGVALFVYIVGTLIPKGHVASRSAKFKRSPQEVWNTITDFATAPSWRLELKSIRQLPDRNGRPVWVETSRFGPMTYEVREFDPPKRLVTLIADDELPFGGNWTYEISAADSGSVLTITENGEIYNPIFRFVARFFFGHQRTIEAYLKALGKKFGEQTAIIVPDN